MRVSLLLRAIAGHQRAVLRLLIVYAADASLAVHLLYPAVVLTALGMRSAVVLSAVPVWPCSDVERLWPCTVHLTLSDLAHAAVMHQLCQVLVTLVVLDDDSEVGH